MKIKPDMFNWIKRHKAKKRIPLEAYKLIENISSRYSQLDFNGDDFAGLDEREKLSKLIDMINHDAEISRLNFLSMIGSIRIERQQRGRGIYAGSGSGINLCIGENGLFVYDWDDFADKHQNIPATTDILEKYVGGVSVEELRKAIVGYTDRRNYIQRVTDFNKFN